MHREQPILVVGAGFAGCVMSQQLAASGRRVLLIDRRNHIGGNAYDTYDDHGVLIHPYGAHIFHTNARRIVEYLSKFTEWRFYEHRALSKVGDGLYPIPINRTTINRLYQLNLDETGVREYFETVKERPKAIANSEDAVVSTVGRDLFEKFYKNYIRKQWNLDASELSASVALRIPVRTSDDDRYHEDLYQLMPSRGYTAMFRSMVGHPNIEIQLRTEFASMNAADYQHVVYTGPIDNFYEFRYGKLPYRSLKFEHEHIAGVPYLQEVGQVNYPNTERFTRIIEFKHLTGQTHNGTSILKEYPLSDGEPYYPVPTAANEALLKKYEKLATSASSVTFVGRLAQYRYYNMDQVVGAALSASRALVKKLTGSSC